MQGEVKAVIFDMDGVLIESEHLWRRAMIEGFEEFGMLLTEDDCRKTTGLRIGEVIALWLTHFKLSTVSAKELENRILELLMELIAQSGVFIQGIPQLISFIREKKLKIGLATSSSVLLMNAVLKKLDLAHELDASVSAEFMRYGKPHPEVFLACAEKLKVAPQQCIVIEDSINGVIAGRAAQMIVIAVPDIEHLHLQGFAAAHHQFRDMHEVLAFFKTIFM